MYNAITISEFYAIASVTCKHPDDFDKRLQFVVSVDESAYEWFDEYGNIHDDTKQMVYDIRDNIEKKVNPHGYWHEVEIELAFMWNNNILDTVSI